MSLQGLPFLPREIILDIMEILIAEAEELQTCILWEIHYTHEARSKLLVAPCGAGLDYDRSSAPFRAAMKERFRSIRLVLHSSRVTRAMAHRTFVPMTAGSRWGPKTLRVKALVLPKLDYFHPSYPGVGSNDTYFVWQRYLQLVIRQPGPESFAILERIEHVYFYSIRCLVPWDLSKLGTILALPNLKDIIVDVGIRDVKKMEMTLHGGERFIDPREFPQLSYWRFGYVIPKLSRYATWAPFLKKGVKLFGCLKDSPAPFMEIMITKTDISYKYLNPKCSGGWEVEDEKW